MGVKLNDIKELFELIKLNFNKNFDELSIIELGEEEFKIFTEERNSSLVIEYLDSDPRPYNKNSIKKQNRIGLFVKDYLENFFKNVLSISSNTKCPKTTKLNICQNKDIKLDEKYDILINFGFTQNIGVNDVIPKI